MRSNSPHLTLVPTDDVTVHIVLDDLGQSGRVYREADEAETDINTVINDIISGQYKNPNRVVAFNTAEGWARDVTEDVAREVLARAIKDGKTLSVSVRDFIERKTGQVAPQEVEQ
jgi:hypothetical protein